MIHIFIGTKAQFIKVAPVLRNLDDCQVPYRLIDSCQHKDITSDLRAFFGIRQPDISLETGFSNINSVFRAILWVSTIMTQLVFSRRSFRERIFGGDKNGICLIHGDTLSTLLGLITARSCGLKVAHLEAGLRSFDLFDPFPEELIRIICMRFSDYLFAPSSWAENNLRAMKVKGRIFKIEGNTVIDSLRYIMKRHDDTADTGGAPYTVVSIHRFENLYSRRRMAAVIDLVKRISSSFDVFFIMHRPTSNRLARMGLLRELKNDRIHMDPIAGYGRFIALLKKAEFIVTDGGSIQEESCALNVPCLLMRMKTERQDGLGGNVRLGQFDEKTIGDFLVSYKSFRSRATPTALNPSKEIVRILRAEELENK
ncbi:MAG: UDP-N-acetylglucosamine 2-epimerase [Candidatus Omnitrophota bacterium]|nr:UDP-N-acetylglucosamine 2-epimerase [Candidatus Omnitrophota bacterium]